ncbi:MAG: creatininase family protein [Armatimonadota bacterium]
MYSVENTWKEIRDCGCDTAVVAIGSIEQHGHHLPLGTDWFQADWFGRKLAERLDAFYVPAMPFGTAWEHQRFPGTISLRPETLAAVLRDIVMALREHGFRRIVLHNGHGANWILKPTVRQLNYDYQDISIIWSGGVNPEAGDEPPVEIHSGESETSRMMYLTPDLVKDEGIVDSPGRVGQEFLDYVGFDRVTKTGAWGLVEKADPEKGREIYEQRLDKSEAYVKWAFEKVEELKNEPGVVEEDEVQNEDK